MKVSDSGFSSFDGTYIQKVTGYLTAGYGKGDATKFMLDLNGYLVTTSSGTTIYGKSFLGLLVFELIWEAVVFEDNAVSYITMYSYEVATRGKNLYFLKCSVNAAATLTCRLDKSPPSVKSNLVINSTGRLSMASDAVVTGSQGAYRFPSLTVEYV